MFDAPCRDMETGSGKLFARRIPFASLCSVNESDKLNLKVARLVLERFDQSAAF